MLAVFTANLGVIFVLWAAFSVKLNPFWNAKCLPIAWRPSENTLPQTISPEKSQIKAQRLLSESYGTAYRSIPSGTRVIATITSLETLLTEWCFDHENSQIDNCSPSPLYCFELEKKPDKSQVNWLVRCEFYSGKWRNTPAFWVFSTLFGRDYGFPDSHLTFMESDKQPAVLCKLCRVGLLA